MLNFAAMVFVDIFSQITQIIYLLNTCRWKIMVVLKAPGAKTLNPFCARGDSWFYNNFWCV